MTSDGGRTWTDVTPPALRDRPWSKVSLVRRPEEEAAVFFRRVDGAQVKAALADLEASTPTDALPEDFVDLGEDTQFKVEAEEDECSA